MLRPRSENTRGITHRNRKTEENDGLHVNSPVGKPELQQTQQSDLTTPLLKDKDVNQQRSMPSLGSTKTTEKDRSIASSTLKSPSQKGSKFKVFSDKENVGASTFESSAPLRKKTNITPVKRAGSSLETWTPVSKRVETEAMSSSARDKNYLKEEDELPYVPEVELDFSAFDDQLDFGVYEQITAETSEQDEHEKISTKIHLGNIEEEVKQVDRFEERESSPIVMDQTSNILNDLEMIQMPSEVEYGPPKEKELAYEPAVSIDVSEFSELLPDITAYEYKNDMENEAIQLVDDQDDEDLLMIYTTKWMASITTENHDDTTTEEFELLDNLDQDPFFTNEETEQDPELLFANHLFNVDEYINQQQQQQQIIC